LGTTAINNGNWHHIVGVFNSDTDKELFIDGNPEGTLADHIGFITEGLDQIDIG